MSDLIDRQAAIEVVEQIRYRIWGMDIPSPGNVPEYIEHHMQMQELLKYCDALRVKVENLPSAPERKTGKWTKLYAGNYKCSECGDWWGNDDNEMVEDFKFCPNCGAEMEKEVRNEAD